MGEPAFLEAVRDAAARGERIEIDYWSAGRDELTTRRIDPEVAFFAMGEWYLSAYCHRADDERMFRVDRIRALRPTGEHFDATPRDDEIAEVFTPRPNDPRVTLELAPAAAWVAEAYPAESTTARADGTIEVVLAVSEPTGCSCGSAPTPVWSSRPLLAARGATLPGECSRATQGVRSAGRTADRITLPGRTTGALTRPRGTAHERMIRWSPCRAARAARPTRPW